MSHLMDDKIPSKWGHGVWGQNFKFWDPIPKFGTVKARHFKFDIRIDLGIFHFMNDKIPQRGVVGILGRIFKFWDPSQFCNG